jgi:hypothetical protein
METYVPNPFQCSHPTKHNFNYIQYGMLVDRRVADVAFTFHTGFKMFGSSRAGFRIFTVVWPSGVWHRVALHLRGNTAVEPAASISWMELPVPQNCWYMSPVNATWLYIVNLNKTPLLSIFPFILTSKPPALIRHSGCIQLLSLDMQVKGISPSVGLSGGLTYRQPMLFNSYVAYISARRYTTFINHCCFNLVHRSVCGRRLQTVVTLTNCTNFKARNDLLVFCFCTGSAVASHFTLQLSVTLNNYVHWLQCLGM